VKVVRVLKSVQCAFKNMGRYPGLFMLLNQTGNQLPGNTADEIARIISKPMSGDDVDRVMGMINPYLDDPLTA
jgi:hypothetical protein